MSEAVVDDIVAVLPPLLQSLEALGFIARYLNPPDFDRVMQTAGTPDTDLRAIRPRLAQWPADFDHIRTPLEAASDAALAAFEGLRAVQNGRGDFASLFRALRYVPRAQEALYALSSRLPPVSAVLPRSRACAKTPIWPRGWRRRPTKTPASSTITTSPAAAAASRSMCRNTTRRTAPGRW